MTKTKLLPLALLYADRNREIKGITRLQKLIFLAQKEHGLDDGFDFEAYDYGPYSQQLYDALDTFEERGLVSRKKSRTRSGNERYDYSLTEKGRRLVSQTLAQNQTDLMDTAQEVKQAYNDDPIEELLQYVYNKHPEYTENSKLEI